MDGDADISGDSAKSIGQLAAELLAEIDRKREARRRKPGAKAPGSFVQEASGHAGKVAEFEPHQMEKAPAPGNGRKG